MDFKTKSLIDTIAFCDGNNSLKEISKMTNLKIGIVEKKYRNSSKKKNNY